MAREFALTPKRVPRVETRYRRITTDLPAPQSIPTLERLYRFEPIAMRGQPPVVWDHAEGFQVYDPAEGDSARGLFAGQWRGVVRPLLDWTTEER